MSPRKDQTSPGQANEAKPSTVRSQPWMENWPPSNSQENQTKQLKAGDGGGTGALPASTTTAHGVELWRLDNPKMLKTMMEKKDQDK